MRLSVSRSSKNISAQIIDDSNNKTLISATSNLKSIKDLKKKIRNIRNSCYKAGRTSQGKKYYKSIF